MKLICVDKSDQVYCCECFTKTLIYVQISTNDDCDEEKSVSICPPCIRKAVELIDNNIKGR